MEVAVSQDHGATELQVGQQIQMLYQKEKEKERKIEKEIFVYNKVELFYPVS